MSACVPLIVCYIRSHTWGAPTKWLSRLYALAVRPNIAYDLRRMGDRKGRPYGNNVIP